MHDRTPSSRSLSLGFRLLFFVGWLALPRSAEALGPLSAPSAMNMGALEAWRSFGLQVQMSTGYEWMEDLGGPGGEVTGVALTVEPSLRLNRLLSLTASLRYTPMGGGLRWTNSVLLVGHGPLGLFVAGGGGFGGLLTLPLRPTETMIPEIRWQPKCTGTGTVAIAQAGWLLPLGESFATGPVVQRDLQWTSCGERQGVPPTAKHRSTQIAWSFGWR